MCSAPTGDPDPCDPMRLSDCCSAKSSSASEVAIVESVLEPTELDSARNISMELGDFSMEIKAPKREVV